MYCTISIQFESYLYHLQSFYIFSEKLFEPSLLDGGKAMDDHKAGPSHCKPVHCLLHLQFRSRIHGAGRLIKDQKRCVFQHCSRDRDQLSLPLSLVVKETSIFT